MIKDTRKKHRANAEGSTYRDPKGGWRGALTVGWIGNTPKRKFFRGDTQGAVLGKIQKARRDLRLGIMSEAPERQTVEQYLARWIEDVARQKVRPTTLRHYQELINNHIAPAIGRVALIKLAPQHVQMMLTEKLKSLSPKTCQHLRTCLRVALGTAVKWGLIQTNAAALIDPPPLPEHHVRSLTEEELGAFEKSAQAHPFGAAFVLALSTGARQGEVLGLQWPSVNLAKKQIQISVQLQRINGQLVLTTPKTKKSSRTILLCDAAVKALEAHKLKQEADRQVASTRRQDLSFVFADPNTGGPLDPCALWKYFHQVRKAAGIENLRFHDLRHSCASFLLANGVPVKMISELLGHSSTSFTMDVYSHVLPKLQQQAATEMDAILEAARKAQREREEREKADRAAAGSEKSGEAVEKKELAN